MVDPFDPTEPTRYLFVHVMKVGGGSFKQMVRARVFPPPAFYPGPEETAKYEANIELGYLREIGPGRRQQIRFYSGHFPFVARELIVPRPRVLAFFRHPVDRAVSWLKQHRRNNAREATLEDIYERTFISHVHNHMTKVFGMRSVDEAPHAFVAMEVDRDRLEIAKQAVDELAFIGIQEQFRESVQLCERTLGWKLGQIAVRNRGDDGDASHSLRVRIERDCELDMELYEYARERFRERLEG
jgi:hypothetical protein